jgi:hypothetical protein
MASSLDFLIVMAVLYLVECVRRVGPDELTLDRRLYSGFRLKRPAPYPNNAHWGWVMLNPLRPDGPSFSLRPTACLLADDPGDIPIEGAVLRNLDGARFDLDGINEVCATLRRRTSNIRRIALALLAVCFGLFPACLFFLGLRATLLPAAAATLLASMCIAVLYRRIAKLIAPCTTALDLYGNVAKFALYPISAIRCMDLLSRDSLEAFDPIAVATVLCGREQAARLAARELVILRYSVPQEVHTDSRATVAEYRAASLQLLESFVTQQRLPVRAFIDPPAQPDQTCETYCPACGVQFRLSEGVCPDCPNIFLQPLRRPKRLQPVESKEEAHA